MTPLLTKVDVAARLAIAPRTVLALAARKALPSIRIGACVRFDPADVAAYVVAQRQGAVAASHEPRPPGITALPMPKKRRFS